jgi:hypothetical protein
LYAIIISTIVNSASYLLIMALVALLGCQEHTMPKNKNDVTTPVVKSKNINDTFNYFSIIDTSFGQYKLPDSFYKPKKWLKADENRKLKFGDWYGAPYSDSYRLRDALALIDTANTLSFGSAKSWCMKNYHQAFPYLVTRLSDKRKLKISDAGDLIIWDRLNTGDLESYGHGGIIEEDVFTIAGRASWILNELTGENFAVVHANLTEQEAEKFKTLWKKYISKLKR